MTTINCTTYTFIVESKACDINKLAWSQTDKDPLFTLSADFKTAIAATSGNGEKSIRATVARNSGKFYLEFMQSDIFINKIGFADKDMPLDDYPSNYSTALFFYRYSTHTYVYLGSSCIKTLTSEYYAVGDVINVALDLDSGKIWIGKNNTWFGSGNPVTGANPSGTGMSGFSYPFNCPAQSGNTTIYGEDDCAYDPPEGFEYWDTFHETIVDCKTVNIEVTASNEAIIVCATNCDKAEITLTGQTALFNDLYWSPDSDDHTIAPCGDGSNAYHLSNDNHTASYHCGDYVGGRANKAKSTGKWYFEVLLEKLDPEASYTDVVIGIVTADEVMTGWAIPGVGDDSWGFITSSGKGLHNGVYNSSTGSFEYGDPADFNDIIGCAVDLDNAKIWFSINGVWQAEGDPTYGLNPMKDNVTIPTAVPAASVGYGDVAVTLHNYSNLTYEPPELFYAWDYEAPRNETMIICYQMGLLDLTKYRTIIDTTLEEEEEGIDTSIGNIRVLNFRSLIGV